jgi:hypothetical protein
MNATTERSWLFRIQSLPYFHRVSPARWRLSKRQSDRMPRSRRPSGHAKTVTQPLTVQPVTLLSTRVAHDHPQASRTGGSVSRSPIPLLIDDLSQFATQLRDQWPASPLPQTQQVLGLIAQAIGYRTEGQPAAASARLGQPGAEPRQGCAGYVL